MLNFDLKVSGGVIYDTKRKISETYLDRQAGVMTPPESNKPGSSNVNFTFHFPSYPFHHFCCDLQEMIQLEVTIRSEKFL